MPTPKNNWCFGLMMMVIKSNHHRVAISWFLSYLSGGKNHNFERQQWWLKEVWVVGVRVIFLASTVVVWGYALWVYHWFTMTTGSPPPPLLRPFQSQSGRYMVVLLLLWLLFGGERVTRVVGFGQVGVILGLWAWVNWYYCYEWWCLGCWCQRRRYLIYRICILHFTVCESVAPTHCKEVAYIQDMR